VWTGDEDAFYGEIDNILSSISYAETTQTPYNFIRFHKDIHSRLVLEFQYVVETTPEEHRRELRKKLMTRINIQKKAGSDPKWKAYDRLRSHLPEHMRSTVPSPDQVAAQPETYRNMLTMIPQQNPLHAYLSLFSL
jgi:hypothetical protein